MVISDFWVPGQSLINKNCHNSRTSNDIDMKLGSVTKIDKRDTPKSTFFSNLRPILSNQKPDAGILLMSTLQLTKTKNRIKTFLENTAWKVSVCRVILVRIIWTGTFYAVKALILLLWVKVLFQENADFCKENSDVSKIKGFLVLKGIFSETKYACVYLRTK